MSDERASPFVPGARVAISIGYPAEKDYREAFVEKVYKNGNFTLRGDPKQQWKPFGNDAAFRTGSDRWDRTRLEIWDQKSDARITAAILAAKRRLRWYKIRKRVENFHHDNATDAMMDAIEAALPAPPTSRDTVKE